MLIKLLWAIYLALLAVLLPHTAWAFAQFEPVSIGLWGVNWGLVVAWTAAFAFEAAIAALTHRLSQHITSTPRYKSWVKRVLTRYANVYSISLVIAMSVSALANSAHAREFGRPMAILTGNDALQTLYEVAFSTILPLVSLLFASVLSSSAESDLAIDEEKEALRKELTKTKGDNTRAINALKRDGGAAITKLAAEKAELIARLERVGALRGLVGPDKKTIILTAHKLWPQLPQAALAEMSGASSAHVSNVIRGNGHG